MDKINPEMIMTFLVVAAALIGFVLLCWNLIDKIKSAKKPNEDLNRWRHETDEKLRNDNERIKAIKSGNDVVCRGILAILSHEISGNSIDKLKESQTEITNYLIDR